MLQSARIEDRACTQRNTSLPNLLRKRKSVATPRAATGFCDELRTLACDPLQETQLLREGLESCTKFMLSFAESCSVQKSGLLALAILCEKQQLTEAAGGGNGVQLVVNAWQRFPEDCDLVKNAIVTMRSLSGLEGLREQFCDLNGLRLLIKSMQRFSERASIQCAAFALLANLGFESESRKQQIVESGAISVALEAVERFKSSGNKRLHTNACIALRNLSASVSGVEEILRNDEGLSIILEVLNPICHKPSTADEALGIVANLVLGSSSPLHPLLQPRIEGILDKILEFLRCIIDRLLDCGTSQELCYAILAGIAKQTPDLITYERNKEILQLAILSARTCVSLKSAQRVSVVTQVCSCIRVLLCHENNRRCFAEIPESVEIVTDCVEFLSNRPLHVEHALVALGNAVFDSTERKRRVRDAGAIDIVHSVIERHFYVAPVAEAALRCLHAICIGDDTNSELALGAGVHSMCLHVMTSFPKNAMLQERGLAVLLILAAAPNGSNALREVKALDVAKDASRVFPYSRAIAAQEASLRVLVDDKQSGARVSAGKLLERLKSFPKPSWGNFGGSS